MGAQFEVAEYAATGSGSPAVRGVFYYENRWGKKPLAEIARGRSGDGRSCARSTPRRKPTPRPAASIGNAQDFPGHQDHLARRNQDAAGKADRGAASRTHRRMIEEPYRWVEAIANRARVHRDAARAGQPDRGAELSRRDFVRHASAGRGKNFSRFTIGSRMGAIGHPGDIERLRMAAIELASTEGFTRSAADVSLRRLALLFAEPGSENGLRAGLRRALSGADDFRGSRRDAGGRSVSAGGIRRRDRDQRRPRLPDAAAISARSAARARRPN